MNDRKDRNWKKMHKFSCRYKGWNYYCDIYNDLGRRKGSFCFSIIKMENLIAYTSNYTYSLLYFYVLGYYSKYEISQKFLNCHKMQTILHKFVNSFWFCSKQLFLTFTKIFQCIIAGKFKTFGIESLSYLIKILISNFPISPYF